MTPRIVHTFRGRDGLIPSTGMRNNPAPWNCVFLVNAYLKYNVEKDLSATFLGHNLINHYYSGVGFKTASLNFLLELVRGWIECLQFF